MNGIHLLPARMGLALALLAAALLAGLPLSGFLVLALLDLHTPLAWDTYVPYVRALDLPEVRPYAGRIRFAGALGFGVPVLAWAACSYFLLRFVPFEWPARRGDPAGRPIDAAQPARKQDRPAQFVVYTEEGTAMNPATQSVAAAASLALSACATPSRDQARPYYEAATTNISDMEPEPANPAKALGRKLLDMIAGLRSKHDLTVERINAVFGLSMKEHPELPGYYKAQARLNDRWIALTYFEARNEHGEATMSISITRPTTDREEPLPLIGVCLEFEPFAAELEKLGYTREEERYYKDGSPMGHWRFYRRKPDHEYTEDQIALKNLYPLEGAAPVEISIRRPEDEFATTYGESAGGRRCITTIELKGTGEGI